MMKRTQELSAFAHKRELSLAEVLALQSSQHLYSSFAKADINIIMNNKT